MSPYIFNDNVTIVQPQNLYKWAKVWGKIQKNYYLEPVHLRREKQIEDFIFLNEFNHIYVIKDTDILKNIKSVDDISQAELVVITDQKFSRLPCSAMLAAIEKLLTQCPRLYLCLNRHYINIDNTYQDTTLNDHFPLAITQWLRRDLTNVRLLDLSLDYLDRGDYFTWVVPDRMYYIERA
jgi:hypothetical protein